LTQILPQLAHLSLVGEATKRLEAIVGVFRYRTRLKESPMFVLERIFQFQPGEGGGLAVKVFEGPRIGNKTYAEGYCFHHQLTFFVFVECTEPPYQPLIYAYRDPQTPRITSLNGVSIAPHIFSNYAGCPLARLVFMNRITAEGRALGEADFDPDVEFSTFIPADACNVLTTF
jgi:hypothetical protein